MPYCLKARTLLHAHLNRLNTLSEDLEKGKSDTCDKSRLIVLFFHPLDKRYVVRRAPYLINEMINIEAQLVAMGHAGRREWHRLDTPNVPILTI
jgi:hypothetical protein